MAGICSYEDSRELRGEAKYGVKVPAEKVVLSGNSTWSGSGLENRDIKLDATIQFPEEGYWIIYGRFTGENWTAPYESRMAVVVTRDAAGVVGTPEFNSGPLARFGDFSYGEPAKPSPSELHPVTIELDISKPPRAGEEATITYRIDSLNDISDFSTELRFFRRSGERVSADKLLVKGEAITELDLKAGVPAEISATVVFPDADDWRIAGIWGFPGEHQGEDRGRWRWNRTHRCLRHWLFRMEIPEDHAFTAAFGNQYSNGATLSRAH